MRRKIFYNFILFCFLGFFLFSFAEETESKKKLDSNSPALYSKNELKEWCEKLSSDLKSVNLNRCLNTDWLLAGHSVLKRPIFYTMWGDPKKRRVLVIGSIHGDEITSVSLTFRWLEILKSIPKDSILNQNYFMVIPLLNPDGYYKRPRTRANANGVDLNRNFNTENWNTHALRYWQIKTKKDPRRFPGNAPASEPETKIVQKLIDEFKPEFIISIHAPYGLIDYDGKVEFPKIKKPMLVKRLGTFPGSLGQYAGIEKNIPVVTLELKNSMQMPPQKTIEELLEFIVLVK
jgi:hypothetical protein